MLRPNDEQRKKLERDANIATRWIGSTTSLIVHTIAFLLFFALIIFGASVDRVLLVLTTAVSLEAIYLAIFIQMTVNKNTADIEDIAEDVEDIQEDIDEIQVDVDEIQEDVEDIQEDIDEIQVDVDEIQEDVEDIQEDEEAESQNRDDELLQRIEGTLRSLIIEVAELKENATQKKTAKKKAKKKSTK